MGPLRLRLRKPCLAAIEGFAVAGGLELALLADLRIAQGPPAGCVARVVFFFGLVFSAQFSFFQPFFFLFDAPKT
jgi:1,4-dihydroxy-2-naphthoyl-CoA synthase